MAEGVTDSYDSADAWQAWNAEMLSYGYTQDEIDAMQAGDGGGSARGEDDQDKRRTDAEPAWEREVKRIFVLKRLQGAEVDEGGEADQEEDAATPHSKRPKIGNEAEHAADCDGATPQASTDNTKCHETEEAVVRLATEDHSMLTRERFWDEYMIPNRPLVVQGFVENAAPDNKGKEKQAHKGWRVWREWVTREGEIDVEYLKREFADVRVTAHNTSKKALGLHTRPTKDMTVADFVDWWLSPVGESVRKRGVAAADRRGFAPCTAGGCDRDSSHGCPSAAHATAASADMRRTAEEEEEEEEEDAEEGEDVWYLKDWNFTKEFPSYGLYTWPPWFEVMVLNPSRNPSRTHMEVCPRVVRLVTACTDETVTRDAGSRTGSTDTKSAALKIHVLYMCVHI